VQEPRFSFTTAAVALAVGSIGLLAPGLLAPALLASGLLASGCTSTCATGCPEVTFTVAATQGENLDVDTATWAGPGCPPAPPGYCLGDSINNLPCVRFFITGSNSGACQLDLTFNDGRAPFSAIAQFGPETHQGCCHGFPVDGPTGVTIPPLHPKVSDASADVSGTADAAADGGANDVPAETSDGSSGADSGNDST
jgi:hypothetical protein